MEAANDDVQKDFWPEYITNSPGLFFFFKFFALPALAVYIVWAYIKTFRFAINTIIFYRRFFKKDERGMFEIPTTSVRRRNLDKKAS